MTAPSQTSEAAGLEDAGHIVWWKAGGVNYYPKGENFTVSTSCRVEPLVTAASAQAAIDAEKAKVAELEALVSKSCDLSVEQTDKLLAMHERATAAEAELAKVRKALNRTRDPHWTLFYVKEALQQETQP